MMKGSIIKVGTNRGLIIPEGLVEKYGLTKVIIEDTGNGILIKPATSTLFEQKLHEARENKQKLYSEMRKQADDPSVQAYYSYPDNNLSEIDIIEG